MSWSNGPRCVQELAPDITIDRLLDGLCGSETQQAVEISPRHRTINEAPTQVLGFEAVEQLVREQACLQAATTEPSKKPFCIKKLIQKVLTL